MMRPAPFAAALALDALLGDPQWVPHPVQAIGAAIAACDRLAQRADVRERALAGRIAGIVTVAAIVGGTAALCAVAPRAAGGARPLVAAATIVAAASTLAWRSLIDAATTVEAALQVGDLRAARRALGRIVGRDTAGLDETAIARAVIETLAESSCDGIVAPLLYLAVGGVPLAMTYKAINTLDSMIGHLEPPYRTFGWAAARLDDAANLVPARVCALAIAAAAQLLDGRGAASAAVALADARAHRSPNAGWPEAAAAGALAVRLGGRVTYDGVPHDGAVFGADFRAPSVGDLPRARRLVTLATALVAATLLGLSLEEHVAR